MTKLPKKNLRSDKRPLYKQALVLLQQMIETGEYKHGERLPAEDAIAAQFGITRPTLRRALSYLEARGFISRKQGIGTFVTLPLKTGLMGEIERLEPFRDIAKNADLEHKVVENNIEMIPASEELASLLSIEIGCEVLRQEIVEAVGEVRSFYMISHFLRELISPEEAITYNGSLLNLRKERADTFTRAEIFAVEAEGNVAAKLAIPEGKAVLKFVETHFTLIGRPIGTSLVYTLTDQFRFYAIRRVR